MHAAVAKQAESKLKPYTDRVKLNPITISKTKNHRLVSNNAKEKACVMRQTYSPGALLVEHYKFLLSHKTAIKKILEDKIQALNANPGFAEAVFNPVLSKNFMKSLNSCKSKVSREGLALTDDEPIVLKVIMRDMFRFRIYLRGTEPNKTNFVPVLDAIQSLGDSEFVLQRAKAKVTAEEYPKQIIFNFFIPE